MTSSAEIAKMFRNDSREKKFIGSNINKAKGKRGYVGRMYTTVDYLQGKEKKKYKKSGKVVTWNMYKQLIPLEELQTYTKDNQKIIVEKWIEVHTPGEIIHHLGISQYKYYKMLQELEINKKWGKNKKTSKENTSTIDIGITFNELKKLPKQERYYKLNDLYEDWTAEEIADAWGKTTPSIYSLRYSLKKYLTKNNLPLEREYESDTAITPPKKSLLDLIEDEPELKAEPEPEPEIKQQELESNPTIQPEQDIAEEIEPRNVPPVEPQVYIKADTLIPSTPVSNNNVQVDKDTLNEMQEIIKRQEEEIAKLNHQNQVPEPSVNSGMNFTYSDQKEGFLVHHELKQFISMLEKNPSEFKVDIKIKRVEE